MRGEVLPTVKKKLAMGTRQGGFELLNDRSDGDCAVVRVELITSHFVYAREHAE